MPAESIGGAKHVPELASGPEGCPAPASGPDSPVTLAEALDQFRRLQALVAQGGLPSGR